MAQRRHHYEVAFESFLRDRRIPYVAVDEARKALLPESADLRVASPEHPRGQALKSFDFVIYSGAPNRPNILADVKGRKVLRRPPEIPREPGVAPLPARNADRRPRLESWVTLEDIDSLSIWESLFGPDFAAAFVFLYWCDDQPPDGLFQEIFDHRGRWYAVRAVTLSDYRAQMKLRSPRWGTVHLPTGVFERVSRPFSGA